MLAAQARFEKLPGALVQGQEPPKRQWYPRLWARAAAERFLERTLIVETSPGVRTCENLLIYMALAETPAERDERERAVYALLEMHHTEHEAMFAIDELTADAVALGTGTFRATLGVAGQRRVSFFGVRSDGQRRKLTLLDAGSGAKPFRFGFFDL